MTPRGTRVLLTPRTREEEQVHTFGEEVIKDVPLHSSRKHYTPTDPHASGIQRRKEELSSVQVGILQVCRLTSRRL